MGEVYGTVYTETVVHSAPEAHASEAPYQTAIIELINGGRVSARIEGPRVAIGDRVIQLQPRDDGVLVFGKTEG